MIKRTSRRYSKTVDPMWMAMFEMWNIVRREIPSASATCRSSECVSGMKGRYSAIEANVLPVRRSVKNRVGGQNCSNSTFWLTR